MPRKTIGKIGQVPFADFLKELKERIDGNYTDEDIRTFWFGFTDYVIHTIMTKGSITLPEIGQIYAKKIEGKFVDCYLERKENGECERYYVPEHYFPCIIFFRSFRDKINGKNISTAERMRQRTVYRMLKEKEASKIKQEEYVDKTDEAWKKMLESRKNRTKTGKKCVENAKKAKEKEENIVNENDYWEDFSEDDELTDIDISVDFESEEIKDEE